jgi:hypothetical protein
MRVPTRVLSAADLIILSSMVHTAHVGRSQTHRSIFQPGGTRLFHNADGALLMIGTQSSGGANTISTGVFSHVEGLIR